jgi:hypothetical protein
VLLRDCEKNTTKLRELTYLATWTTTASHHLAIVTRMEAFAQLVDQTIKELQEQALAQTTSAQEAVAVWVAEQMAPGRAGAQPKVCGAFRVVGRVPYVECAS